MFKKVTQLHRSFPTSQEESLFINQKQSDEEDTHRCSYLAALAPTVAYRFRQSGPSTFVALLLLPLVLVASRTGRRVSNWHCSTSQSLLGRWHRVVGSTELGGWRVGGQLRGSAPTPETDCRTTAAQHRRCTRYALSAVVFRITDSTLHPGTLLLILDVKLQLIYLLLTVFRHFDPFFFL